MCYRVGPKFGSQLLAAKHSVCVGGGAWGEGPLLFGAPAEQGGFAAHGVDVVKHALAAPASPNALVWLFRQVLPHLEEPSALRRRVPVWRHRFTLVVKTV